MNKISYQNILVPFFGNLNVSRLLFCLTMVMFVVFPKQIVAQDKKEATETKEQKLERIEEQTYLTEAAQAIKKENFVKGEANYRKAISVNEKATQGNYNLGNAYYRNDLKAESMDRFKKAAITATEKPDRHRAFHNLGNSLMDQKEYAGAVEAYKNALRNNPTDDETRYNLALAKELLEKNPPEGGGDDENEDENKDDQDKEDQQDQKDKEDKKDGEDGKDKDEQDKGDEEDKDKEGENEDKGKPDEGKDDQEKQGEEPQQQQPIPGKLSPQEVKNLLESMNNEEKKVQDKINAKKQKGAKVKSEKDW